MMSKWRVFAEGDNCSILFCPRLKLIMGKSLEIGPCSIKGTMGHFATIFSSKLITFFKFPVSEYRRYPKQSVALIDLF